ncbi:MAG: hypothetical protein M1568_02480 [Acidobacteria bacterium]|nr:hypothetical protein [Acidobacteriota bacterium]
MQDIIENDHKLGESRRRGEGPEAIVREVTLDELKQIGRIGIGFQICGGILSPVTRIICRISNFRIVQIQSANEWWKEFKRLLSEPKHADQRRHFLRMKPWNWRRKLWALASAYLCVQHRRIQTEREAGYGDHVEAANALVAKYKDLKTECEDAFPKVERLAGSPGMWRYYAAEHKNILSKILDLAEEGAKRSVPEPSKRFNKTIHPSNDALLLRMILLGCGKYGVGENKLSKFTIGRFVSIGVEPMMKWFQLAEQAGGLHPRSVPTLMAAADSYEKRTRPSTMTKEHVKKMQ